ncbi:TcpE family conjugal transfer membrane protein [Streptosporangium sp. NPDC049046]|uniref:TcpE family conjugal transfer membrane protein n=1 Tax=Streptosporangium sp. NPDC049046 TaxID=3155031 RepID=UPI00342DE785
MDLPTYTNIWRIEKRLYKLYDLRLPMPLPIVWIGGFVGVLAPWSLLLYLLGLPFAAPWHVLYLVPPGVVTWLSTRPVIESKRLTELLQSQVRYVGEPRTWCRMAPLSEPAEVTLTGRIWRAAPQYTAVRVKASRKARHAQAKRAAARREVRPAVAAAAAAAATAPVATAPVARTEVHALRQGVAPALGQTSALGQAAGVGQTSALGQGPAAETSRGVETSWAVEAPPVAVPAIPAVLPGPAAPSGSAASSVPSLPVVTPVPEPVAFAEAAEAVESAPGTPILGPASRPPADHSQGPSEERADRTPPAGSAAEGNADDSRDETPAASGASAAPPAPIGTEALRRLRRLAASAEAERAAAAPASPVVPPPPVVPSTPAIPVAPPAAVTPPSEVIVPFTPVERPNTPIERPEVIAPAGPPSPPEVIAPAASSETDAPASKPSEERPEAPAVPEPSAPRTTREETSAPARAVSAERLAVVPDPVRRPSEPAAPSFVPRFVGPAPVGRRAEAAELPQTGQSRQDKRDGSDEESARRQHRKGQPTPIGRAAETPETAETAEALRASKASKAWPPERPASAQAGPGAPAGTGVQGGGMSIRAVPSGPATADPVTPAVPVTGPARGEAETRVRRVESVVGRDSSGGWRRLAQVVIGPGGGRTDGSEIDEARARAVFSGSRRVVVLGCTGGAGQTTTALMLGHTLARYREDRILAVDASTGSHALSSRIQGESPETLTSLLSGLDSVQGYLGMRAYTSRCASGLEVLAGDSDAGAEQRLSDRTLFSDRRLGQTMDMLDRHYKVVVMDPAAALAARVLPYADQLVLVVPASEDGPDAVAMTYEWLDGHGCSDLRHRAVMVVNGVSRRSMADVEQAEAVARGRCRAIVRVPWEDALAPGRADRVEPSHLRAPGRRAYLALAGVVVAGFGTVQAGRPSEEELAQ